MLCFYSLFCTGKYNTLFIQEVYLEMDFGWLFCASFCSYAFESCGHTFLAKNVTWHSHQTDVNISPAMETDS